MKKRRYGLMFLALSALLFSLALLVACNTAPIAPAQPTVAIPQKAPIERIGIFCRDSDGDCVTVYNGADINVFSDEGSTIRFAVEGSQGLVKIAGATAIGTATPAVIIQNSGVSNPLEIRNAAGTPIAAVQDDGAVVFAGSITSAGAVNGGGVLGASFAVAPTTVATATPVFYVNSASGNTANLMEARVANTPVAAMDASGNITQIGSVTGSNWAKITAPTAIATATPAFVVDTSGVSAVLEARKNATPVFSVSGAGVISGASGGPLMYGTANRKLVASSDTITDTLAITHGLSAVAAAGCSMNAAPVANAATCSVAWAGTTITVSVWKSDLTTPGSVGALVNWYALGTP